MSAEYKTISNLIHLIKYVFSAIKRQWLLRSKQFYGIMDFLNFHIKYLTKIIFHAAWLSSKYMLISYLHLFLTPKIAKDIAHQLTHKHLCKLGKEYFNALTCKFYTFQDKILKLLTYNMPFSN